MPSHINVLAQRTTLHALWKRGVDRFPQGGAGGAQAYSAVLQELNQLVEGATALENLRAARNPTETDAAHIKRVASAAQKYAKEVEAVFERANKAVSAGLGAIEARIRAKTQLVPDAYAAEVRALYRGMSNAEKVKLLGELLDEKRGPEFAAIIKAPRSLTGMPEAQRQQFEAAFIAKHAAEELIDQQGLREALDTANIAVETARQIATAYDNPSTLAEIARAEAAAAAASKTFDATVRG
jgi:hypothetical protein